MSVAWRRTAAAGGSDAQFTSITNAWDTFTACLTSAGWTTVQTLTAGTDVVFGSTGENGNEVLFLRVIKDTARLDIMLYQYWSVSNSDGVNPLGGQGGGVPDNSWWIGAGTWDYVITADLDGWAAFARETGAGTKSCSHGGLLKRTPGVNANKLVSVGTYGTGIQTIDVTPASPAALGYKIGDPLVVCGQQYDGPSAPDSLAPLFCTAILNIGANSITIDIKQALTAAGALIGGDPQPYYISRTDAAGVSPEAGALNYVQTSYKMDVATGILVRSRLGYGHAVNYSIFDINNTDPSSRTGRRGLWRYGAYSSTNYIRGYVDKFYRYAGTGTLWDIARTSKSTPSRDYVVFLLTNTHVIGPVS